MSDQQPENDHRPPAPPTIESVEQAVTILDAACARSAVNEAAQNYLFALLPANAQRLVRRLPFPHRAIALRSYCRRLRLGDDPDMPAGHAPAVSAFRKRIDDAASGRRFMN